MCDAQDMPMNERYRAYVRIKLFIAQPINLSEHVEVQETHSPVRAVPVRHVQP